MTTSNLFALDRDLPHCVFAEAPGPQPLLTSQESSAESAFVSSAASSDDDSSSEASTQDESEKDEQQDPKSNLDFLNEYN